MRGRSLAAFAVILLVASSLGCLQDSENLPPRAVFEATSTSTNAGDMINFDASNSSDDDGAIATFHWDWGDGFEGFGPRADHTYARWGTYNVTLTVTDDRGKKSIYVQTIVVNAMPIAVIDLAPRSQFVGEPVMLSADRSIDPDGRVTAYEWNFGDGNGSTTRNVDHTFVGVGRYEVSLRVWDDRGASSKATDFVEVTLRSFRVNFTLENGALPTTRNYTLAGAIWADNTTMSVTNLYLVKFTLQWRDTIHPPGGPSNDMFRLTVSPPQGEAWTVNGTSENLSLLFPLGRVPINRTVQGRDASTVLEQVMEEEGTELGKGVWYVTVELVEAGGFRDDSGFIPDPGNMWELAVTYETYTVSVVPAT
jgi:chitodextrinase